MTMPERVEHRLLLPLLLVVVSLFLMVAFQTGRLLGDHGTLTAVRAAQEPTIQEGTKLRQQLANLAGQTAQLAAEGDTAAQGVVDEMRKQGFALSPPKP
ncbi:MAG TPA: hypothetical protein VN802_20110 [Stellaceae bacterium]|nr:hypothetical protein [Stellaceae bacterium]